MNMQLWQLTEACVSFAHRTSYSCKMWVWRVFYTVNPVGFTSQRLLIGHSFPFMHLAAMYTSPWKWSCVFKASVAALFLYQFRCQINSIQLKLLVRVWQPAQQFTKAFRCITSWQLHSCFPPQKQQNNMHAAGNKVSRLSVPVTQNCQLRQTII